MSTLRLQHFQAALHLLRYLKGSTHEGLFYHVQPELKITGFSYADWGSCLSTRRSLTTTTAELVRVSYLFNDLCLQMDCLVTLFCDNKSAQMLATNPCFHERTKHLGIDCHFTRGRVQSDFLQTTYVNIWLQLADVVMTKALDQSQHDFLVSKLELTDLPTWGGGIESNKVALVCALENQFQFVKQSVIYNLCILTLVSLLPF